MLDDVKVLDVTQVVSGSFASMSLADMGAEVVKIERPKGGDIGRRSPPYVGEHSSYYVTVNRNKQSVSLDLKSDEGNSLFLELAEEADVVVENFRPGTMGKFGIGYEAVSDRNPEIIYCSITGFGQTGPYREYPALDIIAQAMSGNMSITGPPDSRPYRSGIPIADIAGSMYAVQGILGALYRRERTGEGNYIDISMLEGILSWLTVRGGYTFATGEPYPRMGNKLDEFVPYGVFETADSYLALVVLQNHHWRRLCDVIDRPELADDERFRTAEGRRKNRDRLEEILNSELGRKTAEEWFEQLAEHNVPAGPIYDTKEVWDDEHVRARGLLSHVEIDGEEYPVVGNPVQYEHGTTGIRRGISRVGEETRETLKGLGYDEETITELLDRGVIGAPETSHPDH